MLEGNNIRLIYRILNKNLPGVVSTKNDGWMLPSTQLGHILGSKQLLIDFLPAASKKDFQYQLLMDLVTLIFKYVLQIGLNV